MPSSVAYAAIGLVLLYLGAEWLVKGAAGLARSFGIPAIIVGLTVVGYGTSAPEMTVSIVAAVRDSSEIAVANVIGSNIANLGLILGLTAVLSPPRTDGRLVRREIPLLLASVAAVPVVLWDGVLSRIEAAMLVLVAACFTLWLVRDARVSPGVPEAIETAAEGAGAPPSRSRPALIGLALGGLAVLVLGGELLVRGATGLARALGLSDHVIGLTVVAIGTSLPELATSVVAARRGHSDLAVGNVVGSNLYNVLLVLAGTALVRPIATEIQTIRNDLVMLGAMTLFAAVLLRTARTLRRWEGGALLVAFAAFIAYALW
ncbi:MAG: calcium/sodium antiporter [Deltaproteobacteria bacterium]|nr:calcium/sodium antiporter [Deltaproteobacteria bacterium]